MRILAVSVSLCVLGVFVCCAKPASVAPSASLQPGEQSALAWQIDATFPNWIENANRLAMNSLRFQGYQGQGSATITVSPACLSFSLYVNGKRLRTSALKAGGVYTVDLSRYTRNGRNTLLVADVQPPEAQGAVRVQIPYPVVIESEKNGLSKRARSLIKRIISRDIAKGFTSAQLAIIKDGRLIERSCWGNLQTYDEHGRVGDAPSVTNDTLYDLASVTKMIATAYAVQLLVSDGRLSLETKIVEILGDAFAADTIDVTFANKAKIPLATIKAWKRSLTVRDVLTHTAGFSSGYPYFNDNFDLEKGTFNIGENKNPLYSGSDGSLETRSRTLQSICRTPLIYEPGTSCLYSDIDFMLLTFVIEEVTGERLDVFLHDTFWKPLGLTHITYNPLEHGFARTDCAATEATGNSFAGELSFTGCRTHLLQGEVHDGNAYYAMAGISGHAGLFANATDLARLASVMLTGGYGNNAFFSRNVLDTFTAPQSVRDADYGLGWWRSGEMQTVRNFGSLCSSGTFGHNGFTGTLVCIEPEEQLVIIYLTNKINTPLTNPKALDNQFEGNSYLSAHPGFIAQIVLLDLTGGGSAAQWRSLEASLES